MDCNSLHDLERLAEQIFSSMPAVKSREKQNVVDLLKYQLIVSKPVVQIQRMDSECERLIKSLKQRLMLLQDVPIHKEKETCLTRNLKTLKKEEVVKLNLSSDSSDDETLSELVCNQKDGSTLNCNILEKCKQKVIEMQQADTSESFEDFIPLALRRMPRERKLSYKSFSSSASTSHSKKQRTSTSKLQQNKHDQMVTTSEVTFHSEEMLVEREEVDTTPTLHIKIPSLHRGNVHYIILDSLKFARKVFDYRANEAKQQQSSISSNTSNITKSRKKISKTVDGNDPPPSQLTHQEQEFELSQLIQDVLAEACHHETLQATSALENINQNLIDNYDSIANDDFLTYSQSSQELSYSQNSQNISDAICSTSGSSNMKKKQRKNSKRFNQQEHIEPPKKRGRKPKKKNTVDDCQIQSQPPTKSNLAKYVEFFSNDCELLPGSTTPAASSTRSQPLVSSTTHNFEVVDQLPQQNEEQSVSQQPITYYIDGDWANGGPCQLVATNSMSLDARQINQDDINGPFQDFVNYIDNSGDSGSNVIARVLESNNSLPISIPLPVASLGLQNKHPHQNAQRQTQQSAQNSFLPIINIQIPTLPNDISGPSVPPPAHTQKGVLDLSVKSKSNVDIISSEVLNYNKILNKSLETLDRNKKDDCCLPLDLSAKGVNASKETTNNVTIDNQDEDFIRRLIEQSEFQYGRDEIKKGSDNVELSYNDNEDGKSFKAALDMPLLDFDATDLAELVEDAATSSEKQQNSYTDKIVNNDITNNEDSNYVSMSAVNLSLDNDLNFSDQSTTEIFNKLLDICPDNQILDNINNQFISNDDLDESVFENCKIENSTMCEIVNSTKQENQSDEVKKSICCAPLGDEKNKEYSFDSESLTSSSLAVQIDSSSKNTDLNISRSSDMSTSNTFSNNDHVNELSNSKETFLNLKKSEGYKINDENSTILDTPMALASDKQTDIMFENIKTATSFNKNNFNVNTQSLANDQDKNDHNDQGADILKTSQEIESENNKSQNKDLNIFIEDTKKNLRNHKSEKHDKCADNLENKKNEIKKYKNGKIDHEIKSNKIFKNQLENKRAQNTNTEKVTEKNSPKEKINKPNENVVFSVEKITLSDDDNLYITDSDTASGKSYDVGFLKLMDCDDQSLNTADNITKNIAMGDNIKRNDCFCNNSNDSKSTEKLPTPTNCNENSNSVTLNSNKNRSSERFCTEVLNLSVCLKNYSETGAMDRGTDTKELSSSKVFKNDTPNEKDDKGSFNETNEVCIDNSEDILMITNSEISFTEATNLSNSSSIINIENDGKDLYSYSNDDTESSHKNNSEIECNVDAKKDLECCTVESPKPECSGQSISIDLSLSNQNLSLLELESKLEGSLDFDEDFDDALSLATSCFDSPTDDRFEDSTVIENANIATPLTNSLQEQQHQNINSHASGKELKLFKIPKLSNSLETPISNVPKNESSNEKNDNPTTTSHLPKIIVATNMEKIIRTVKNDIAQSIQNTVDETRADSADESTALEKIIHNVFGITCLPFLVDKCYDITHCNLLHQLNDIDTVYQALNSDKINVNLAYQVLYNHSKLFKVYFTVFLRYYTTNNERTKLLNMINDCERYPEYAEFIINIYEALVKCGLNRVNACRLILKRIREKINHKTIIEALVAIIIKSDWTMFTDYIEKYTQEVYKFNFRIGILEQMASAVLNSKGSHLKQIFGKCVQTLHCDDTALLLNSPSLIQCVALLTTNT